MYLASLMNCATVFCTIFSCIFALIKTVCHRGERAKAGGCVIAERNLKEKIKQQRGVLLECHRRERAGGRERERAIITSIVTGQNKSFSKEVKWTFVEL